MNNKEYRSAQVESTHNYYVLNTRRKAHHHGRRFTKEQFTDELASLAHRPYGLACTRMTYGTRILSAEHGH